MGIHEQRIYDGDAIRELEKQSGGYDTEGRSILMERAGLSALDLLLGLFHGVRSITVACGSGNNGGDGLVLARHAKQRGLTINTVIIDEPKAADARIAWQAMLDSGVEPIRYRTIEALPAADVIVDALFGIGLDRPPEGEYQRMIKEINASKSLVLALDVPSGLQADTGHIPGVAVHARATVTFLALKPGLLTGRGREVCGEVVVAPLEVSASTFAGMKPTMFRLTRASVEKAIPRRAPTAHKGDNGHVLVVGGDDGMGGAATMCAEAALRSGAGLVSVLTHRAHAAAMMTSRPELMVRGIDVPIEAHREVIDARLNKATVIALGPGLGGGAFGEALYDHVMHWRKNRGCPLILDADGLNWLAGAPQSLTNAVLTPHPGEAARLLQTDTRSIGAHRPGALAQLIARYGGVVLLKGAGTLIGNGVDTWLCDRGNAGMATGGMGDVLTGIIAGLTAQGLATEDAARCGAWLHARSADALAEKHGMIGLLPSDVIVEARRQLNKMATGEPAR